MQITYKELSQFIIENHASFRREDGDYHLWTYKIDNSLISFKKIFESKNKFKEDNNIKQKFHKYLFIIQSASPQNPGTSYLLINNLDKIIDADSGFKELREYGLDECIEALRRMLCEIEANSLNAELPQKNK